MLSPLARAAPGLLHNQSPRLWRRFFLQTRHVPTPRNFDSQPGPRSPGHGPSTKQRRFHLVAIKDQRGPIADHTDNKVLWRFRKGARNLVQRPNLLAIDFVDNAAAVWREICVNRVWQDVRQHNDVRMLQVKLLDNKVFEKMTEA